MEGDKMYDRDIREPLFDYLEERFGKCRIFEEKRMGRSRADIIMVLEDRLIGLEIKSDADTYERLKRQATDYNKFCDYIYIVIGKSHSRHVSEHVAKCWGILCVSETEGSIEVSELREAGENSKCKLENQLAWMWRPELAHMLALNGLPRYREKSKQFVQDKLMERVDSSVLKRQMCDELFERDYTLWDTMMEEYRAQTKKSARTITVATLPRRRRRRRR
ncbi:MAG: sce7726 family protein [Lachnospiraceae bacterium]|nr:sce7726 family protein [Lachnospiraceae bacterium]